MMATKEDMTVTNCADCGSHDVRKTVLPAYDIDLGGIEVRLVDCVTQVACGACGEDTIEIPDLDGLSKTAAMARALVPFRLAGKEVRFMRLALDMTGREFAAAMELTPETVSRWENETRGVGGSAEKLLRHNICALLRSKVMGFNYDPADIAKMRILNSPEGFKLPPLEFTRVAVNQKPGSDKAWDQLLAA